MAQGAVETKEDFYGSQGAVRKLPAINFRQRPHEITYGLAGHAGTWADASTDWEGYRLTSPLMSFTTGAHDGPLGRAFSPVHIDDPGLRILALKKTGQ